MTPWNELAAPANLPTEHEIAHRVRIISLLFYFFAPAFAARFAAQYLRIRSPTAFRAAADIPLRLRVLAFLPFLIFAQRAFCAAAIVARPAADSFPRLRLLRPFRRVTPVSPDTLGPGNARLIWATSASISATTATAPRLASFVSCSNESCNVVATLPPRISKKAP